jgi:AraC-like DNA-binding protein
MPAGAVERELGYTVAGSLLARLLREAAAHGADPEAILAAVGVERGALQDPAARVARRAYHRAFELAASLSGRPDFGLLCGERATLEAFHVVGYVLAGQARVADVLERLCALHRLLDDASVDAIHARGGRVTLVTQEPSRSAARPRQAAEFAVASLVSLLRAHTGGQCVPTRVAFMHPRPASVLQHVRVFKVVPQFSRERIEVELESPATPLFHEVPPPLLTRHLERYARSLLAELPARGFVDRVERAVLARLSAGPPSVKLTARALGMSARTLQRRLAELGQSFVGVVDRVRRETARHCLAREDATLDEVAAALGFRDARSLRRATRRWFGAPAAALRRRGDES